MRVQLVRQALVRSCSSSSASELGRCADSAPRSAAWLGLGLGLVSNGGNEREAAALEFLINRSRSLIAQASNRRATRTEEKRGEKKI